MSLERAADDSDGVPDRSRGCPNQVRTADYRVARHLPHVVEVDSLDVARTYGAMHLTDVSILTLGTEIATGSVRLMPSPAVDEVRGRSGPDRDPTPPRASGGRVVQGGRHEVGGVSDRGAGVHGQVGCLGDLVGVVDPGDRADRPPRKPTARDRSKCLDTGVTMTAVPRTRGYHAVCPRYDYPRP